MPKLLFTDEQKAALAKEAGITGTPDTNNFDREYDPSSGEEKMYIKLGDGSKFFGKKPMAVKAENSLDKQAEYFQNQYQGKTMQEIYQAMMDTAPQDKNAIRDKIGMGPGGIYSNLEGISQQIANLQKAKVGNQAEIFSAVGPDGKPIDPRIAVANYEARQKAIAQNETVLRGLEDVYRAQLETLTDAEYSRQTAENKKTEIALGYLQDKEDKAAADVKFEEEKRQYDLKLSEEKRQYDLENGVEVGTNGKPITPDNIISYSQSLRGRETLQCGELVNDYVKMATGTKGAMGDTYASKVDAIKKIGQTEVPVEGGVFAFSSNTWAGASGHTGIVKKVNEDGSITVLEANVENKKQGGVPKESTYSAEQVKKMVFSQAPGGGEIKKKQVKPKTFNEFAEGVDLSVYEEGEITKDDIDVLLSDALREYPTEKPENIANALKNRAGKKFQTVLNIYGNIGSEEFKKKNVVEAIGQLEEIGITGEDILKTFQNVGFFDTYKKAWHGDADQLDALEEWADDNGIDISTFTK